MYRIIYIHSYTMYHTQYIVSVWLCNLNTKVPDNCNSNWLISEWWARSTSLPWLSISGQALSTSRQLELRRKQSYLQCQNSPLYITCTAPSFAQLTEVQIKQERRLPFVCRGPPSGCLLLGSRSANSWSQLCLAYKECLVSALPASLLGHSQKVTISQVPSGQ